MSERKPAPDEAFTLYREGEPLEVSFEDFRGKVLLVNFWATWCPPCVKEMPSLDRLQAALGEEGLVVLPLSLDRGGAAQIAPFFEKYDFQALGQIWDKGGAVAQKLGVVSLPVTFLIDREGKIIGGIKGEYEWDSPSAQSFLREFLAEGTDSPIQQSLLQ